MTLAQSEELKRFVHETIGSGRSKSLLAKIDGLLADAKMDRSQSCAKIVQLVSLFISPELGGKLRQKFDVVLQ